MATIGYVNDFVMDGFYQGRVMTIAESREHLAYEVLIKLEIQVTPSCILPLPEFELRFRLPFGTSEATEFFRACGLRREPTATRHMREWFENGRRPLMIIECEEADPPRTDVKIKAFIRCRELTSSIWR
jgi:hypothetical protein